MLARVEEGEENVEVFCFLHIRKDETIELYGVPSFAALKLFKAFRDVSGIGPKAAMLLSSLGTPEEIRKAIEQRNLTFFKGLKGIGEKKIQKVIVELTGKLENVETTRSAKLDDALESLVALGFSKSDAKETLSRISPEVTQTEQRVKEALRLLGRR